MALDDVAPQAPGVSFSTDRQSLCSSDADLALAPGETMRLRVPATSANMGPGFDSFGFAVDLHNELVVTRSGEFGVEIEGEGAATLPRDESNAIVQAVKRGFAAARGGAELCEGLHFTCVNNIPTARGLGSSSAALVAGLAAGLELGGRRVCQPSVRRELLQLAADAEGHPDNVAPAIYGGFQVSINTGSQWVTQSVHLPPSLQAVLFIPDFESLTSETRAQLPSEIPVSDAVYNISRAAMLVNSFATGNFEALRYACQDCLHQPVRGAAFPLGALIDAALAHGAHGAFLSGAGPTVLALTGGHGSDKDADSMLTFLACDIAEAMRKAAEAEGMTGRVVIATPTSEGVVRD